MASPCEKTESFGWLCNMTVVRLPATLGGGCLIYSPVLDEADSTDAVVAELTKHKLLPVRFVLAPTPQHHLALAQYQRVFPGAFYMCGKASPQMSPLTKKRRDLRFDGVLKKTDAGDGATLAAPSIGGSSVTAAERAAAWELLCKVFRISVMADNRTGEVVLLHRATKTLILSDLLYKSNPAIVGPGGVTNHYSFPEWFAAGQQELFYGRPQDNSGGLLPSYRTHPRMRTLDIPGLRQSLERILSWPFDRALACHIDPVEGEEGRGLLKTAWAFLWEKR